MSLSSQAAAQSAFEDSIIRFDQGGDFGETYLPRGYAQSSQYIAIGGYVWFPDAPGYVQIFDAQSGMFITRFDSQSGNADDFFGSSIHIQDEMVLVGALADDTIGHEVGAAYLFDIQTGKRLHKLLPNDGAIRDHFGAQVLIHDGMAIVSAPRNNTQEGIFGAIYFFDLESGEQLFVLYPEESSSRTLGQTTLAMDAGVLAVGAWSDSLAGAPRIGSVFLFDVETRTQIHRVNSEDSHANQQFGLAVSLDQGMLAVGARHDDQNGIFAGAVYLFDVSSGEQLAKILPADGAKRSSFGTSVHLANGLLAVGTLNFSQTGVRTGAYIFDTEDYHQVTKLLPSNGNTGDEFGASVFIDQRTVYVRATRSPFPESGGSVYVYDQSCAPDLNFDGITDFFDVSTFIQLFRANDLAADFLPDGQLNFFDIGAYIGAYAAGCP